MIGELFDTLNNNNHVLGLTESTLDSTILYTEIRRDLISGAIGAVIHWRLS